MKITIEQEYILNQSKAILAGLVKTNFSKKFGKGYSERCIETPWVASHLRHVSSVLDIGFTFASAEYLGLLLELKNKYGVTLDAIDIINPQSVRDRYPRDWFRSISEVKVTIGDVRNVDLSKKQYDVITMISTIEHIGFDEQSKKINVGSFDRKENPEDVIVKRNVKTNDKVLNNLYGALKENGKIFISVPMGRGGPALQRDSLGYYCAQWEYENDSWNEIVNHKDYKTIEQRFFGLSDDGWMEVDSPAELIKYSSYMKRHAEGCAVCILEKI